MAEKNGRDVAAENVVDIDAIKAELKADLKAEYDAKIAVQKEQILAEVTAEFNAKAETERKRASDILALEATTGRESLAAEMVAQGISVEAAAALLEKAPVGVVGAMETAGGAGVEAEFAGDLAAESNENMKAIM